MCVMGRDKLNGTFNFSIVAYCQQIVMAIIAYSCGIYYIYCSNNDVMLTFALMLDLCCCAFAMLFWAIMLVHSFTRGKRITNVVQKMLELGQDLGCTSYGATYVFIAYVLTLLNIGKNYVMMYLEHDDFVHIAYYTGYPILTSAPHLIANWLSMLMMLIGDQLHFLTKQLELRTTSVETSKLVHYHENLSKIAFELNELYNIFLLVTLTFPFGFTILKTYTLIVCIVKPNEYLRGLMFIDSGTDVVMYASTILVLIYSASNTMEKVSMLVINIGKINFIV